MEQGRLDQEGDQEMAMGRTGTEENNTDLPHSTHTNVQVSDTPPRGASVLILTYVSTHTSV